MNIQNYSKHFTEDENAWLAANTEGKNELFDEIEEIFYINPLESGEPAPHSIQVAIQATKLTIRVSKNKILAGPYDTVHYEMIKKYFPTFKIDEKFFWQFFSYECINKKDEGFSNKERIYLSAIAAMALNEVLDELDTDSFSAGIYNMATGKTEYIKGMGVNAVMI